MSVSFRSERTATGFAFRPGRGLVEIEPVERDRRVAVLPGRDAKGDVAAAEAVEWVVGGQLGGHAEVAQAVAEGKRRVEVLVVLDERPVVVFACVDVDLGPGLQEAGEPHSRERNRGEVPRGAASSGVDSREPRTGGPAAARPGD